MICTLSNIRTWHDCFQSVFNFSHAEKEGKRKQKPGGRFNSHRVADSRHSCPLLQVGLSIQGGGLDVAQAVGVAGAQQQHVSGEDLVASQPDEVSHPHLLPVLLHIASLCSGGTIRGRTVKDAELLFSTVQQSKNGNFSPSSINLDSKHVPRRNRTACLLMLKLVKATATFLAVKHIQLHFFLNMSVKGSTWCHYYK